MPLESIETAELSLSDARWQARVDLAAAHRLAVMPLIVAVSAPTALAVRTGDAAGMTLVGSFDGGDGDVQSRPRSMFIGILGFLPRSVTKFRDASGRFFRPNHSVSISLSSMVQPH